MPGQIRIPPYVDTSLFAMAINHLNHEVKSCKLPLGHKQLVERALRRAEVLDQLFVQEPVECLLMNAARIVPRPAYDDLLQALQAGPCETMDIVRVLTFKPQGAAHAH